MAVTSVPRIGSLAERLARTVTSVLVVEDDPDVAAVLRVSLRLSGLSADHLRPLDAAEVVDHVRRTAPACVLLDHRLCIDLTSFDVLEALTRAEIGTPVVVVSADHTLDPYQLRIAGASTLVRKPFSAARLVATVEKAVAGRVLQAESF